MGSWIGDTPGSQAWPPHQEVPCLLSLARLATVLRRPGPSHRRAVPMLATGLAMLVALTAVVTIAPSPVLGATSLTARCDVNMRTKPSTTSNGLRTLDAGTRVTAAEKVKGSRWSARCAGDAVSGAGWWKITAINGKSVRSLFGRDVVYGAGGMFRARDRRDRARGGLLRRRAAPGPAGLGRSRHAACRRAPT